VFHGVALLHRQLNHAHEVGRVTGGGEGTSSVQCLVQWARVAVREGDLNCLARFEVDIGHLCEQHLGVRLAQHVHIIVPTTSFQVKAMHVRPIVRRHPRVITILLREDLVVKFNLVDSDDKLTRIVLFNASQERLSEEETGNPEARGCSVVNPVLDKLESLNKVHHVGGKGLQGRVTALHPHGRDSVVEKTVSNRFEFHGHHDFSLDSLANVGQRLANKFRKTVETKDFLQQYSIH
jgi:hypothetical protein